MMSLYMMTHDKLAMSQRRRRIYAPIRIRGNAHGMDVTGYFAGGILALRAYCRSRVLFVIGGMVPLALCLFMFLWLA